MKSIKLEGNCSNPTAINVCKRRLLTCHLCTCLRFGLSSSPNHHLSCVIIYQSQYWEIYHTYRYYVCMLCFGYVIPFKQISYSFGMSCMLCFWYVIPFKQISYSFGMSCMLCFWYVIPFKQISYSFGMSCMLCFWYVIPFKGPLTYIFVSVARDINGYVTSTSFLL